MKITAGLLLSLLLLGCSTTHQINSPDAQAFHKTIGYLKGEKVRLVLKDSVRMNGSVLEMGADSIQFLKTDSGDIETLNFPVDKIARVEVIKVTKRGETAVNGAAWGAAITGVFFGTLIYATAPDHCEMYDLFCVPQHKVLPFAIIGGTLFSVVGALPGALVGGLVGHSEIYQYQIGDTLNNVAPRIKSE